MSTPTLTAYRSLHPEDTDPDSIVVPRLIQQFSEAGQAEQVPDLYAYAAQLNRGEPNLVKDFVQSTVGGVDQAKAAFHSLVAQGGDALSLPGVRDWGLEGYQRNVEAAAMNAPSVPSINDIHGVSDALHYGVGLIGSQTPMIAGTIAATAAGAAVGSAVGPEGSVAGGVEGASAALAVAQATKNASAIFKAYQTLMGAGEAAGLGAVVGGQVGAGLAGYAQSQNYAQLALSGAEDPLMTSAAIGAAGGLLMSVVPTKALRGAFGNAPSAVQQQTLEQFLTRGERQIPGLATYIALHGAEHAANGSIMMLGQELVTMSGEAYAHRNDPNFHLSDSEIADRLINGATAGALMGATFGAVGAPGERKAEIREREFAQGLKSLYDAGIQKAATKPTVAPVAPVAPSLSADDLSGEAAGAPPATNPEMPFDTGAPAVSYANGTPTVAPPVSRVVPPAFPPVSELASERVPGSPPAVNAEGPEIAAPSKGPAPATYHAFQEGIEGIPGFELWNLTSDIPGHPAGSTVSRRTLEAAGYEVPPAPIKPMEAPTPELPAPQLIPRAEVAGKLPELRSEMTVVPTGATLDTITELGAKGIRGTENTKKTTKKLIAVRDNDTGEVRLLPVFKSSGNRLRVDNGVVARVATKADLAEYLGETTYAVNKALMLGRERADAINAIWASLRKGERDDQYLDELVGEKNANGDPRYTPLGFLDAGETAAGRHFVFPNEAAFRENIGAVENTGAILTKGNKLGTQGVDATLARITQIAPEEGRGVAVLASFLSSVPRMQASLSGEGSEVHLGKRAARAESDAGAILDGLLRVPDARTFVDELKRTTNPMQLFKLRRDRLFGLFTPTEWEQFKTLTKDAKVTPEQLMNLLDRAVKDAGWKNREEFLNSVTPEKRESQLGMGLEVVENDRSRAENEGLTGLSEDTSIASPAPEVSPEVVVVPEGATEDTNLHDVDKTPEKLIPERAEGVAGLTPLETGGLAAMFRSRVVGMREEVRDVLDARADSEISTPKEDLEFQAVKGQLASILKHLFGATRQVMPKMTDDFLYGVYSNLDRIQRDSHPERTTYRDTSDAVTRRFQSTVNTLAGMGISTHLIDAAVSPAVEFLRKNWGRAISYEDGRRMIVMGLDDVTRPSTDNLKSLFHEVAHHILGSEPVWMQRLIHESVERLADLQGEVFSKTWDRRIARGNPDNLPIHEFYEEIMAEHLSHFGMADQQARSLTQKFVDALTKVLAQAVGVFNELTGANVAPELTRRYVEIRMTDFLDRVVASEHDLATLTGNVRETAGYQATFYQRVGGELGEYGYDPDSGHMFLKNVLDDSTLAARFNLDNALQFHDVVVRNTEADKFSPAEIATRIFGVTDKPQSLGLVLERIVARESKGLNAERIRVAADLLLNQTGNVHGTKIRVASTPEDFKLLEEPHGAYGSSSGVYRLGFDEILLHPRDVEAGKRFPVGLSYLITHEAVHSATANAIELFKTYQTLGKDFDALMYQRGIDRMTDVEAADFKAKTQRTLDAAEKFNRIYKWLSTDVKLRRAYGMENLHEFAAEMLTESAFQHELLQRELPSHLQFNKNKPSIFRQLVDLVTQMIGLESKAPKSALTHGLSVLEELMDASSGLEPAGDGSFGKRLFLPTTEAESDRLVKNDYEFHFARLNSQLDFYTDVLKPLADGAKIDFNKYLNDILRIYNPNTALTDVQIKLGAQQRPLQVNEKLRLTDVAGSDNRVVAAQDRGQLIKSLEQTVSSATNKLTAKISALNSHLPELKQELERSRERFVRFETIFHDVAAVRDNALAVFRKSLGATRRGATRMLEWSARHDGLAGVAKDLFRVKPDEELPEDYGELIEHSVAENSSNFQFSDILTSMVKHKIDYDLLTPREIEKSLQQLYRQTKDEKIKDLADGSPKARADLALTIYYAKTNPVDMAAMEIRLEQDPERKDAILRKLQSIIRGNYENVEGLNDLFREVRGGDVAVGKAQRAMMDASRKLKQASKQLDKTNMRVGEMNKAVIALTKAIGPWRAELGIRGDGFSATDGSKILRTPNLTGPVSRETLRLGKDSDATVTKLLMENIEWLKANAGHKDEYWHAVNDQVEGLKKVAGDFTFTKYRDSLYTKAMESLPERMNAVGHPLAKLASNRVFRWLSKTRSAEKLSAEGYRVGEVVSGAMKALGFENSYEGFKDVFWNPANHFRQHLKLLPTDDPIEQAAYSKEQLRAFFQRNEYTRTILQKTGGFDQLWDALETNAKLSKKLANLAAEWGALVEDTDIKVTDPRTLRETYAKRPALDVGYGTTQRSLMKQGIWIKRLLESVKGPENNSLWAEWAHGNVLHDPKMLFTDDVLHHFVRPYIYDASTLHLDAPALLDGETRNRAHPLNVQTAFEASANNMIDFANRLFDLEDVSRDETPEENMARRKEYVDQTLGFFKSQYLKLYNITKRQEAFNKDGISMLSSPMMDNRKMDDLPPEFLDYYIYDKSTVHGMVSNLAAHSELGRDLGQFDYFDPHENKGILWELSAAAKELELQRGDYKRMVENILRETPTASVKQVDAIIEARVGKTEFNRLKNLVHAEIELGKIQNDLKAFFTSPNGSTRELNIVQRVLGLVTGAMTSSFKTALLSSYQIFEPFNKYGVGKIGLTQVSRNLNAFVESGAGSIVQGLARQSLLASKWARFMNDNGIGLDPANQITASQIVADPGKNNVYADQRVLGWLTKMRGLVFDTGLTGPEGERIAPAIRPLAPSASLFHSLNQAGIQGELQLYNDVLKTAVQTMEANPAMVSDPAFKFSPEHLNVGGGFFDKLSLDEMNHEFKIMGTTLEIEARNILAAKAAGNPIGEIVLSPDLARLVASRAMDSLSLHSSVGTIPVWAFNSKVGQMAMPLLRWPLAKMNQLIGSVRDVNGEVNRRSMLAGAGMLLLGAIPSAIAISILLDQYDEKALGKKSNLIGFNWDSPSQTAQALTERLARVGTFGLLGDVINGVRVYGTDGDLRGISLDQRVVFMNSILSVVGLANTAINQKGSLTYDTFYRPLMNLMGGTGILQGQQILNNLTNNIMGAPVFTSEAQSTARINAINYLRGAGRVLNLNVRNSNGMASLPNPEKPWVNQMVVAAYTNDREVFIDAYNKAIQAARDEGRPDPVDHVKRAFQSYHPLRYTFQTPPSQAEVAQIFTTLSDKGKEDVQSALHYFNAYAQSLGLKPYMGRDSASAGSAKQAPSAYAPLSL